MSKAITKKLSMSLAALGAVIAINSANTKKAQAAVIPNDRAVYTVTQKPQIVYNNYTESRQETGQILEINTDWKVIRTARDSQGTKWYDLGKNQWVKVDENNVDVTTNTQTVTSKPEVDHNTVTVPKVATENNNNVKQSQVAIQQKQTDVTQTINTQTQNTTVQSQNPENEEVRVAQRPITNEQSVSQAPTQTVQTSHQYTSSNITQTQVPNVYKSHPQYVHTNTTTTNDYQNSLDPNENSAKQWIANHESGNSYSARNGQFVGKYQLTDSYLHGDYSAANQEKAADNYVKSRYGSWTNAKNHWVRNNWY